MAMKKVSTKGPMYDFNINLVSILMAANIEIINQRKET
jgi:hypothetical protein